MNILLVGSGARECALSWKISQSDLLTKLYVWPGNAMSLKNGDPTGLDSSASQSDLLKAMRLIVKTGQGPKNQIPSMGCNIKWFK